MIGQTIRNRYFISTRIGKGAMGTVYRATDKQTGQEVALKVIYSELAVDPTMLERFKREGDALRQLKHPNIVEFIDAFEHDEQYVIVMEYLSGGSLFDLLLQGPPPIERVHQIALDLCDALIRAHRLNIIHRDIKPENILMNEQGTPKLADFGLARLSRDTRMTRSGTQFGTPHYMAPEAWEGKTLDAQADIWSLGILMFEMLTGRVPFNGDTPLAVMNKVFTSQPPQMKNLPPSLVKIIRRMLARDKTQRYKSMREVAVDLERNQDQDTTPQGLKGGFLKPRPLIAAAAIILAAIFAFPLLVRQFESIPPATLTSVLSTPTQIATQTLPSETPIPAASDVFLSEKDGMTLHYVPGGPFIMGSEDGDEDEKPVHEVTLDPFWIDETEVTNQMYALCEADGNCQPPSDKSSYTRASYYDDAQYADYPVIWVSWNDAIAYCSWAGRRLPSEAEWEYAARWQSSPDGEGQNESEALTYPWGNVAPNGSLLNYNSDVGDTSQVGIYPNGKSPYGALDMAGNVWEWVGDFYNETYYTGSPSSNPSGPDSGETRALRGGSWNNFVEGVRSANRFRFLPDVKDYYIGFRCALSASAGGSQ